jgi:hypothetical protein
MAGGTRQPTHCHLLQHVDLGMMGQFLVLDNGQRPGTPSGHRHHN